MRKKNEHISYFPILVDLRKFPCLVVGGGKVALRKVLSLLDFNADVTVVSPKICKELMRLSVQGKITAVRRPYSSEFIESHAIVFSATDNPEINKLVSQDCRRSGVFLNVADAPSLCDFILPANLKRGDLIVSVSSQGKAPFLVKEMKRKLSGFVPPCAEEITKLAGEFRRRLLSSGHGKSRAVKDKAFKRFLSTDWEQMLAAKGKKKSYQYLEDLVKEAEAMQDN